MTAKQARGLVLWDRVRSVSTQVTGTVTGITFRDVRIEWVSGAVEWFPFGAMQDIRRA